MANRIVLHAYRYELPRLLLWVLLAGLGLTQVACSQASPALASGPAPRPLSSLEPHYRQTVLNGWRSFQTSFARDGLACVDCHLDHDALSLWAAAYPKVVVFDQSPYRVKGLAEVIGETLTTHTDLSVRRRQSLVDDIQAYISWRGEGQIVTPGYSKRLSPPQEDLDQLQKAVERGRGLTRQTLSGPCLKCHTPGQAEEGLHPLFRATSSFPRYVEKARRVMSLEAFLVWHLASNGSEGFAPQGRNVTDLSAYLAELAKGQRYSPGTPLHGGNND